MQHTEKLLEHKIIEIVAHMKSNIGSREQWIAALEKAVNESKEAIK